MTIPPPFPWFGGKSRVAGLVWERFGDVPNYVEPFAGSLAVLLNRPTPPKIETVNDADTFLCVAPETRLLAADLHWRTADQISIGDELVGFDEENGPPQKGIERRADCPRFQPPTQLRRWGITTVTGIARRTTPCYRLVFEDGTTVVCSADHQWLAGKSKSGGRGARWVATKNLRCDASSYASHIMKLCDVVEREDSFEAGWLSGFYDGEGSIRGTGSGWSVTVSQKVGPELDRCEEMLLARGFAVTRIQSPRISESHQEIYSLNVTGGMREILRFLMIVRPQRLLKTAIDRLPERSIYGRQRQVVRLIEKELLGDREVVSIETDKRTYIAEGMASHNCNFWRALKADPDGVAAWADAPVNEADLHARHWWLVNQFEFIEQMKTDPDYYDVKIAGWWVWGLCQWIGGEWCAIRPQASSAAGRGVQRPHQKRPNLSNAGRGVQRPHQQRPNLGNAGRGVHRLSHQRPYLGDAGSADLYEYMAALAERLRNVRVCCGDWSRVIGPTPTYLIGVTGVFLDPPYSDAARYPDLYAIDDTTIARDVMAWAIANGDNPRLRIALCGYEGEHVMPDDWECVAWTALGGYNSKNSNGSANRHRERIWFSPHCLRPDRIQQMELPL